MKTLTDLKAELLQIFQANPVVEYRHVRDMFTRYLNDGILDRLTETETADFDDIMVTTLEWFQDGLEK